jgi:RimJ/RimL family protein N-acetyltransferase
MQVFLETERLVLRRFTEADVDNLFDLDSDPEVVHFVPGGEPTPRDTILNETLPRFFHYYARFEGFWLLGGYREVYRGISGVVPLPTTGRQRT